MPWTIDPSTPAYEWQHVANLNEIVGAINARATVRGLSTISTFTVGQNVQQVSTCIGLLQNKIIDLIGTNVWLDKDDPLDSVTGRNFISQTDIFNIVNGKTHFRRKKPREILNINSTVDTNSNARAAGQKALGTGAGTATQGVLYEYVSGTNWTVAASGRADVLDSLSSAPDTCPVGVMLVGDYIGHWVFDEMTLVIEELFITSPTGSTTNDHYEGAGLSTDTTDPTPTYAEAKAAAESDYQAVGTIGDAGTYHRELGHANPDFFGADAYGAYIASAAVIHSVTLTTSTSRTLELWVRAIDVNDPGAYWGSLIWDAQGTSVVKDQYAKVDEGTSGTFAATFPPTTAPPDWPAEAPVNSDQYGLGFRMDSAIWLARWDFDP